jgi:hypothetical protein
MLLVLLPAGAAAQPEPEAARISSEQYIQELDSWIAYFRSIEKGEGTPRPADPPQEWIVTTTSGEFRVDPGFVRDALAGGAELNAGTEGSKPDRERVAGIAAGWLEQMREGAEAHGQPDGSDLREQARAVLSRGEFRRVRAPGFKESVGDKINAALYKLLERIFGARGNLGNITTYVVWALVALAVIALGIWLARMMRTSDDDSLRLEGGPGGDAVSHRPWRTWLQEARVAAAAGDFREAVHLAYWAGIAALEESGAWKPDRARTPREYLRLLPAGREGHEPLGALTRDFERVWYAQQPAHPQDFAASLANLERLGCR